MDRNGEFTFRQRKVVGLAGTNSGNFLSNFEDSNDSFLAIMAKLLAIQTFGTPYCFYSTKDKFQIRLSPAFPYGEFSFPSFNNIQWSIGRVEIDLTPTRITNTRKYGAPNFLKMGMFAWLDSQKYQQPIQWVNGLQCSFPAPQPMNGFRYAFAGGTIGTITYYRYKAPAIECLTENFNSTQAGPNYQFVYDNDEQ
jgi:hypothetical protein